MEIHELDAGIKEDGFFHEIHPLCKLALTILYILLVISCGKYNVTGLFRMSLYLFVFFLIGELSAKRVLSLLKPVWILLLVLGIANPFLDRQTFLYIGSFAITGGMISMLTLFSKGTFSVVSVYLLMGTTTMDEICYGLRKLHVPKLFVTLILLIYRYLMVLLKECERVMQAYSLRAPRQKGIHISTWGPLTGQLLIRSMDRAQTIYENMELRGFQGEFLVDSNAYATAKSLLYFAGLFVILIGLRALPIFELVGSLFM